MRHAFLSCLFAASTFAQAVSEPQNGNYRGRPVRFEVVDGWAIAEGDIILGRAEEVAGNALSTPKSAGHRDAVVIDAEPYRWTNRTVPYAIHPEVPAPERIRFAIQHWTDNTPLTFVERTTEVNYVLFRRDAADDGTCASSVGMIGGQQIIRTQDGCTTGALIHEIGHAVGLYHEQSRGDRDWYLSVLWDNIDQRWAYNFSQRIGGASDIGSYDYGSIMHYSPAGFATAPGLRAIETKPPGIPVGQLDGLSAGDILAIRKMYGLNTTTTVVDTFPAGLEILVDGEAVTTPHEFDWAAGSTHTLEAPEKTPASSVRYVFARWSDYGERTHTITASADRTFFQAAYSRQFRIPAGASPAAGGTVAVEPASADAYYTDGTVAQVTATPAEGYSFYSWSAIPRGLHGLAESPARTVISGMWDYRAIFTKAPNMVTFESNPRHLQVTADEQPHTAPWIDFWDAGTRHDVSVKSPQIGPSGVSRYVFTGWSDGADQEHSVVATGETTTLTANFRTEYLLSVGVDGSGSVERIPESESGFYEAGTTVQLIPRPEGNAAFVNWTGDLTGTEASRTITISGPKVVTALFRPPASTPFNGTLHAATLQQIGFIAPGELIMLNGTHAAPRDLELTAQLAPDGTLPILLGDTRVLIDGAAAPVLAVRGTEIRTMAPFSIAGRKFVSVQIEYAGRRSTYNQVEVVEAVPGIYTANGSGSGLAGAANEDGSANSENNPAGRGTVITFRATGLGRVEPPVSGRTVAADGNMPAPVLPVWVKIGGAPAEVLSVAPVRGEALGLMEVRVKVPDGAPSGRARLMLEAGPYSARQNVDVVLR